MQAKRFISALPIEKFLVSLEHRMSIHGPVISLINYLDFSSVYHFQLLCGPILKWIIDEQHYLP